MNFGERLRYKDVSVSDKMLEKVKRERAEAEERRQAEKVLAQEEEAQRRIDVIRDRMRQRRKLDKADKKLLEKLNKSSSYDKFMSICISNRVW